MKLSPLKPIFNPERSRGLIRTGSQVGSVGPFFYQNWRGLPGAPAGWVDDGNIVYHANGLRSSAANTYATITQSWQWGVLSAGTLAMLVTGPTSASALATYLIAEKLTGLYFDAGIDNNLLAGQRASRDDDFTFVTSTVARLASPIVTIGRWDDGTDMVRVDCYSDPTGRETDVDSQTIASFTPEDISHGIYHTTSPNATQTLVLSAGWKRALSDAECASLATSWGISNVV